MSYRDWEKEEKRGFIFVCIIGFVIGWWLAGIF